MLLVFFLSILDLLSAGSPYVYGGGCTIIKNTLYYVGGATDNLGRSPIKQNFMLDLSAPFSIDQYGEAPWKPVIASGNDISYSNFPAVVPQGDYGIFMFGGEETSANKSIQVLDVVDRSWSTEATSSLGWVKLAKLYSLPTNVSLSKSSFVQSDIYPEEYFVLGGRFYSGSESSAVYPNQVFKYNRTSNSWTFFVDFKRKVQGHTTIVHNGKLFVIGGADPDSGFQAYPLDEVHYIDLRTGLTGTFSTKGDIPAGRVGHSSVVVGSKVYSVGGANEAYLSSFFLGLMIVLDLNSYTWSTINVSGFIGNYAGCLAVYKGVLVHAFGFQGMAMSNTQLISLKDNVILNSLNMLPDNSQQVSAIWIVLTSVFGGILLLLLIFVLVYFIWRRYTNSKKVTKMPLPQVNQTSIWTEELRPGFDSDFSRHSAGPKL
ncbi:hypothetical protein DSO57_1027269 [Entomophthora muscae]|uniref:Uncharacterized protein n=1 Tax=Entomophthora muscae TaxID=34485 RepID=A0ACC2SRD8_9FUNG|nr:hypothetical protein DSO57_1027269 [Entomophthora muscae]